MCSAPTRDLRFVAFSLVFSVLTLWAVAGCRHHKKGPAPFGVEQLRDRKVAVADVLGAKEAALQVELALVNEIIANGQFQLIDRPTTQKAKTEAPDESDYGRLGRSLGADYLLQITVEDYVVDTKSGWDAWNEKDSLLSAEQREDSDQLWRKYYKVKGRTGSVRLSLAFFDPERDAFVGSLVGTASKQVFSRDGSWMRPLKLLEELSEGAIRDALKPTASAPSP